MQNLWLIFLFIYLFNYLFIFLMSVCAVPTCSHQSFDGSSYYVDVDVNASKKFACTTLQNGIRVVSP